MQKHHSTNWKVTATLTAMGLLLVGFSIEARGQTALCAKFVGNYTMLLGSDLDSTPATPQNDHKLKYCDGGDVICGSQGRGFVLTTDYTRQSIRTAWIDLKSVVQYNNPPVPAKSLPRGNYEIELTSWAANYPDGTCIPNQSLAPLEMQPGAFYIAGLRIRIFGTYYDLRFGQTDCAIESSGCPVIVAAGANLDGSEDGSADIWTITPATPDATAILFNGKGNGDVGSKIGYFQVPFTLVFTKAQFASVLDTLN